MVFFACLFVSLSEICKFMKRNFLYSLLGIIFMTATFSACSKEDTYAERREREREQINSFLKKGIQVSDTESEDFILEVAPNIKVISESQFYANDSTTDASKNEYVLFQGSGVYMQIVRKGIGSKLDPGQSATIITRYVEFNIAADSIQSTNKALAYEAYPDVMTCTNSYGVFTASFTSGVMKSYYQSPSVPSGWLIPLQFIRLGRQAAADEEIALVRLIIPSTEGQQDALNNVYPCFYEISYERGR